LGESAINQFVEKLKEEDELVRKEAAKALANIGAPAIESMMEALEKELTNCLETRKGEAYYGHEMGDFYDHMRAFGEERV